MNKFFALGMFMILAVAAVVSADACSIKDLCYNQANDPFCSPADESCQYHSYSLQEDDSCDFIVETDDFDGDGWSASCDADDDNASVQVYFGFDDEMQKNTTDNESGDDDASDDGSDDSDTSSSTSSTKSSSSSSRALDNEGKVRVVIKSNEGEEQEQDSTDNPVLKSDEQEPVVVEEKEPAAPVVTPLDEEQDILPTGMVAGGLDGRTSFGLGLYILIGLIVAGMLFFIFSKKKRKK